MGVVLQSWCMHVISCDLIYDANVFTECRLKLLPTLGKCYWVCTEEVTYVGYYDHHAFTWNSTIWVHSRACLMCLPVGSHFVTGLDSYYRS